MPPTEAASAPSKKYLSKEHGEAVSNRKKGPHRALTPNPAMSDPLLTVEDVGRRLNVSKDWVWDHCSRKKLKLPFIRMGDGALRFRASAIEAFIDERERLSGMQLGGRRRA